jgi:hypothetical protein
MLFCSSFLTSFFFFKTPRAHLAINCDSVSLGWTLHSSKCERVSLVICIVVNFCFFVCESILNYNKL